MASKWDIIRRKPKKQASRMEEEPLCRVIPPLLARDLDVLDLITTMPPYQGTTDLAMQVKNRTRKINGYILEKLNSQNIG